MRLSIAFAAIFAALIVIGAILAREHIDFFGSEAPAESATSTDVEEVGARISFDSVEVEAGVADSNAERIQGLSGRPVLGEREGLLFIFERSGEQGIWMKEMLFPIDIMWFDEEMKLVGLKENAMPESFPEVFRPGAPALYVLEVNAGFAEANGIELGDQAQLEFLK